MAYYNSTQELRNLNRTGKIANLTVRANGGSVTVQRKVGANWINAAAPITADGSYELSVDDAPVQFVVTGAAEYEV